MSDDEAESRDRHDHTRSNNPPSLSGHGLSNLPSIPPAHGMILDATVDVPTL
jgi:hypothetical protein